MARVEQKRYCKDAVMANTQLDWSYRNIQNTTELEGKAVEQTGKK